MDNIRKLIEELNYFEEKYDIYCEYISLTNN